MKEFIISEEDFCFRILDRVPVANDNECILLFRIENGRSIIINSVQSVRSSEIRHAKFNKKVVLSLLPRSIEQKHKIAMDENEFHFEVNVKISYSIQDARKYYFEDGAEGEEKIKQTIKKLLKENNGRWGMKSSLELENYLEEKLEKQFALLESLKIRMVDVSVEPDEDAKKIIQAKKQKTVGVKTYKYQTDEKVAQHEQDIRFMGSEDKLYEKKIERMAMLMQNFGVLGPIVESYIQGDKNGEELYHYIMENRTSELQELSVALKNDLLTQEDAFEKVSELLNDRQIVQKEEGKQLIEEKEDVSDNEEILENPLSDDEYI